MELNLVFPLFFTCFNLYILALRSLTCDGVSSSIPDGRFQAEINPNRLHIYHLFWVDFHITNEILIDQITCSSSCFD